MLNVSVFLSDLQTLHSSSTVQVCLLRFWEARNVRLRRGGELMGVDMLWTPRYVVYVRLLFISIVFHQLVL